MQAVSVQLKFCLWRPFRVQFRALQHGGKHVDIPYRIFDCPVPLPNGRPPHNRRDADGTFKSRKFVASKWEVVRLQFIGTAVVADKPYLRVFCLAGLLYMDRFLVMSRAGVAQDGRLSQEAVGVGQI